jgi:hypothetical protein
METREEIIADVLSRMLEHREFLSAKHTLTSYGRALLEGMSVSKKQQNGANGPIEHQSELVLALELLRAGLLHNKPYSKSYGFTRPVGTGKILIVRH